ncbi:chemotaxis protein CheB [Paradesertivirga mongoliensis]|uniref:histidine kinase n=1 Tax=Paradesertivirga mongoliensis TaxID=2100740 RepID=A0ABW4ZR36_9SPHI|nr:chemotaxis protein CheB [Pedobacter mongoliensis]
MLLKDPHHIIAIGASAGGMEEINAFFDHTPTDGVAYVIVQHLSADFKSRMVELLARHSKLEVSEALDGLQVRSNQVYLIPNDKFMTIVDNKLHLTEKSDSRGPYLTINTFFNSLAVNCGEKAIGIVLSGLGSDGTEGIKAIKGAGGMVIARNPETSEFGSMPSSAISTGLVDFVLEPEFMPQTIEDYVKQDHGILADNKDDAKHIKAVLEIIKTQSPHDFSDYKLNTILRRTKRRALNSGFTSLKTYLGFLKITPEEVEALSKEYLISVTAFFRDKEAFDIIEKEVVPDILSKLEPEDELKVWIAGCATGEEAYSMAILIHEQLDENKEEPVVKIFATDIDHAALAFAGRGIYNKDIEKHVSSERLKKYFIREGKDYKVKPKIRKMVIFARHDLVKNPPYCNMQLISCRNLLIYMTPILQQKIHTLLLFGLKKNGYLFLGASENPLSINESLETIDKKWKIYKNIESKKIVRFDAFSLPLLVDKKNNSSFSLKEDQHTAKQTLDSLVNADLTSEFDCLVVCVDENHQVVKTYGDTSRYMLQKILTSNLTELLPRPLLIAFNTISAKVIKTNKKAWVRGIKTQYGEKTIKVNLSVCPLHLTKDGPRLFSVTLSEDDRITGSGNEESIFDEKIYLDQYVLNLEQEVNELKNNLQSVNLQLDASHENMQSFNEELLSANEEMQSSNEEMQSVNEELHTINTDYQLKNKELLELNDDLNNYFRSNVNGQLFVNNDLLLMKFSPGTVKQINLLPTDVGRPLSNISTNIKFETFIEDIKKVITDQTVITKEIEANDGKWYQIMTMPYIQSDNKSNGAIITFNDITQLKRVQLELDQKNTSLLRINTDLDNFVNTASHDLLAPLANIEGSIAVMNKIKVSDPKLAKFLFIINSSVKKFRALIKDLSVIGKIEHGRIETEMIDLNELLDNIEWSLEDKIISSGAVITRDLKAKRINFSKKNLRSIIYNLISNAIKFTNDQPPAIKVSTRLKQDSITLTVEDNGIGINKVDLPRIFDMYGRLHHDVEGQGIGLSLAKKLIDAGNGSITVESEPGKGTKFIIQFKINSEHGLQHKVLNVLPSATN